MKENFRKRHGHNKLEHQFNGLEENTVLPDFLCCVNSIDIWDYTDVQNKSNKPQCTDEVI